MAVGLDVTKAGYFTWEALKALDVTAQIAQQVIIVQKQAQALLTITNFM